MEDKNKMDQQSGRPNRDQETEKKPQEINRPGQESSQQDQQGQHDQREKKPA